MYRSYPIDSLNLDDRLIRLDDCLKEANLKLILVKGVVWNKGAILDGADLDFYVNGKQGFYDFSKVPNKCKNLINKMFKGTLVVPREDDYEPNVRVNRFHIDAEMYFKNDTAIIDFANDESIEFFESGHYDCPNNFTSSIYQVQFILNRMLEDNHAKKSLSRNAYTIATNWCLNNSKALYLEMFHYFKKQGDKLLPPSNLNYIDIVKKYLENDGMEKDLYFIKPLNRALKEIQGD